MGCRRRGRSGGVPRVGALWALLWLTGCGTGDDPSLLELEGLAPARVRDGETLRVEGEGFPTGRSCRLRLQGRLLGPTHEPRWVRATLSGTARSESVVEARFEAAKLGAMGSRGVFEGSVSVAFEGADGEQVTGTLSEARLEVTRAAAEGLPEDARRSAGLLAHVGLELAGADDALRVTEVRRGSAAWQAGIRAGDRVMAIDGVAVHEASQLLPAREAKTTELGWLRDGEPMRAELSLTGFRMRSAGSAHVAEVLMWTALLLYLMLLSPWSARLQSLLDAVGRGLRAWGTTRASGERAEESLRRRDAIGMLLAGVATAGLAALAMVVPVDVMAAWLGLAVGSLAWRALRVPGIEGGWRAGLGWLLGAVSLGCLAALDGSRVLPALVERQGVWPWQWGWIARPVSLPVAAGYVVCAAAALQRAERRWPSVAQVVQLGCLGALGSAVLAGGWNVPAGVLQATWGWGLALLVWALKSASLGALIWMLAPALHGTRVRTAAGVAVVGSAGTALWMWLSPSPAVSTRVTLVLVLTTLGVLLHAAWRHRPRGTRTAAWRLEPFL